MNSEPREAVNAEPPATPKPAPHDPLITGHFDVPRLEVRISESGAMPAAPMPRVSDERLAQWMSDYEIAPHSTHAMLNSEALMLDLREERAKVAELEARIAESNAAVIKAELGETEREAHLAACVERSEAALARANEALSAAIDFDATPGAVSGLAKVAALERLRQALGAQGSAAQKPEGPPESLVDLTADDRYAGGDAQGRTP